jgi:hypothetical protein
VATELTKAADLSTPVVVPNFVRYVNIRHAYSDSLAALPASSGDGLREQNRSLSKRPANTTEIPPSFATLTPLLVSPLL